jgi:hypothetical protein
MQIRRLLTAIAVVSLPLGLVTIAAGSASASSIPKAPKAPKGTGAVTCVIGGDATFTPPLTANGTPGVAHELVQFSLVAANCTGGTPSPTSGTIVTRAIKVKDVKVGSTKVAGACHVVPFNPALLLKNKISWSPVSVKRSKVKLALTPTTDSFGTLTGYTGMGTAKGSYGGPSSATLKIEALADLIALQDTCTDGDANTSVSHIDFGPSDSLTVG